MSSTERLLPWLTSTLVARPWGAVLLCCIPGCQVRLLTLPSSTAVQVAPSSSPTAASKAASASLRTLSAPAVPRTAPGQSATLPQSAATAAPDAATSPDAEKTPAAAAAAAAVGQKRPRSEADDGAAAPAAGSSPRGSISSASGSPVVAAASAGPVLQTGATAVKARRVAASLPAVDAAFFRSVSCSRVLITCNLLQLRAYLGTLMPHSAHVHSTHGQTFHIGDVQGTGGGGCRKRHRGLAAVAVVTAGRRIAQPAGGIMSSLLSTLGCYRVAIIVVPSAVSLVSEALCHDTV